MALHAALHTSSAAARELLTVLETHFRRHPALALQDVYKLLYQRVFGPEHSLDNLRAARERLYLEILHLPEAPSSEPLLEPLSPLLCRVNLQPFVHRSGRIDALWRAFKQTARTFQPGTMEDFQRAWRVFLVSSWARQYAPELLTQFWQHLATAGFPPLHHSRAYTEANAPHYRVVLCTLVPEQAVV
jgi:hypothetical protein